MAVLLDWFWACRDDVNNPAVNKKAKNNRVFVLNRCSITNYLISNKSVNEWRVVCYVLAGGDLFDVRIYRFDAVRSWFWSKKVWLRKLSVLPVCG